MNNSKITISSIKYTGKAKYMSMEEYRVAKTNATKKYYSLVTNKVPVGLKEINDVYGRCFYLETHVDPTLDQKMGGIKVVKFGL